MNQLIELRLKFPPQAKSSSADECFGCYENVEYVDPLMKSASTLKISTSHKTTSEWTHAAAATLPATVSTERNKALVTTKYSLAGFLGPTESQKINVRLRQDICLCTILYLYLFPIFPDATGVFSMRL